MYQSFLINWSLPGNDPRYLIPKELYLPRPLVIILLPLPSRQMLINPAHQIVYIHAFIERAILPRQGCLEHRDRLLRLVPLQALQVLGHKFMRLREAHASQIP